MTTWLTVRMKLTHPYLYLNRDGVCMAGAATQLWIQCVSHRVFTVIPYMPTTWTEADKETLKDILQNRKTHTFDWGVIHRRLPGKSKDSVYGMIGILGLRQSNWPEKHKVLLRSLWGHIPPQDIKKRFKGIYSWDRVLKQAKRMSLPRGVPRGMVSIHSLQKDPKWGFGYEQTMEIMRWSEVPVKNFAYEGKRPRYCVDAFDAREAVENWNRAEKLKDASTRLGVSVGTLGRWLVQDGHTPGSKKHHRHYPEFYDSLYKKYARSRTKKQEQQVDQDRGKAAA